jgi:peptidoglycan-associated lipoprotein
VKRILLPLLVLVVLGGCETLGLDGDKAAIEDRNAASAKKSESASGTAAASKGTETAGLKVGTLNGQSLDGKALDTGKPGDPRKDPASPLSKRSIYFDYDSFVVKDEYRPMIEAHAAYMTGHRNARIIIQGNADERGSREYNLALGQKRAEAVRKSLAVIGVQEEQLEAVSFGEEKPRSAGASEQDYAENRRADIVYGDE